MYRERFTTPKVTAQTMRGLEAQVTLPVRGEGGPNEKVCDVTFGVELFFLTHVDKRAPAACRREERGKSARALRRIDSWTRSTDLDVLVCTATDRTAAQ